MPCQHLQTRFVRKTFLRCDGYKGFHVMARCENCGENARGPGRWVGRAELRACGVDLETVPPEGENTDV